VFKEKKHQKCSVNTECSDVITRCDSCECGSPIAKEWVGHYEQRLIENCKDYKGVMCDVDCPNIKNLCIKGACVRVEQNDS
jgi:hypothetical protein